MPFVLSGWLRSFRASHYAGVIPVEMYHDVYSAAVEALLDRPATALWVAVNPAGDADTELAGFVCVERGPHWVVGPESRGRFVDWPAVHYLYLKAGYRRMDLPVPLLRAAGVDTGLPFLYTFKTPAGQRLIQRKRLNGRHDPGVARFPRRERAEEHACA
jgi:hypothetical protein